MPRLEPAPRRGRTRDRAPEELQALKTGYNGAATYLPDLLRAVTDLESFRVLYRVLNDNPGSPQSGVFDGFKL